VGPVKKEIEGEDLTYMRRDSESESCRNRYRVRVSRLFLENQTPESQILTPPNHLHPHTQHTSIIYKKDAYTSKLLIPSIATSSSAQELRQ
jgi:hypothetical protein